MPRERTAIRKALKAKGFEEESGGDHWFYVHAKNQAVFTKVSFGSGYKVYSDELLSRMRRQLRLDTKRQLESLIDCPMTREAYEEHLIAKKLLPPRSTPENESAAGESATGEARR